MESFWVAIFQSQNAFDLTPIATYPSLERLKTLVQNWLDGSLQDMFREAELMSDTEIRLYIPLTDVKDQHYGTVWFFQMSFTESEEDSAFPHTRLLSAR